ncbi:ABC transporter substrate-binding protein [Adhaeribacter soli]|uniref:ABC transporter substrate-binding protein n=1 Tax=Adhaeribacter soli TaxID=2607655 RepID=A0A5N1IKW1_9BACT|nr:helical backbone metal receptor [Adhaeribacter soli]KAA9327322.1 ABC transporter substrate-binding protein [Adhaeribacter soli]
MPHFTDQLQNSIFLPEKPRRIVSLVPSQTELLFDLGLEEEVVGITKFCIHPAEKVKTKTKIGGTKNFNFEAIDALQPDLIIGNKEENYQEGIEKLAQKYPVWMSDIFTLEDALDMIRKVGELTGMAQNALEIVGKIAARFASLLKPESELTAAYFIWKNPYMVVGNNTFIDDMLQRCGFRNVFENETRYPEISIEMLQKSKPEVILLSSEPYPFKEKHLQEFQEMLPEAKIMIADGEMFSWYGSRLLQAPAYLQKLLSEI